MKCRFLRPEYRSTTRGVTLAKHGHVRAKKEKKNEGKGRVFTLTALTRGSRCKVTKSGKWTKEGTKLVLRVKF